MAQAQTRNKVGELRPSQILFSAGIGSVIDLPNLSTMMRVAVTSRWWVFYWALPIAGFR
jgi:hypothetical protein